MTTSKNLPDHAIRVASYKDLDRYASAFGEGHLNLLVLLGDPGIGKSRAVRAALSGDVCWIDGNASPFGIYRAAYEHRDQPIVLDDVDGLYKDRNGVRLLKALCQTEPTKALSWQTNAADLNHIPRHFTTTSSVALIANDWRTLNADVAALEDRAHIVVFEPSPIEVHRQAATFFWDQEVFDFVAANLHLTDRHSLRTYILAFERKTAGLDWKTAVLSRCLDGTALLVARLRCDATYQTEEERVRAFVESGGGCRATYFNYARKLRPVGDVPKIILANKKPPTTRAAREDTPGLIDILRQRYRKLGEG